MASCPECDAEFEFDEFDVDTGDTVTCDECGTNLVVIKLSPLELDVAGDEAEDDDEDFGEGRGLDDDGDEEME